MAGKQAARKGDFFVGNCSACDGYPMVTGILLGDARNTFANKQPLALDGGIGVGF
jgi:hypothetical protein